MGWIYRLLVGGKLCQVVYSRVSTVIYGMYGVVGAKGHVQLGEVSSRECHLLVRLYLEVNPIPLFKLSIISMFISLAIHSLLCPLQVVLQQLVLEFPC